jgi:uncharacterized spore protein YtfJ
MDLKELLERFDENVAVGRAFGPSYEKDGSTVIPVAMVAGGGGTGTGSKSDGEKGEGGGFGGIVRPIGVYVVREGDVKFVPSVNASRIAASAIAVTGFVLTRALRRKRGTPRAKVKIETPSARTFGRREGWRESRPGNRHQGETFRLRRLLRRSSTAGEHSHAE